MVHWLSGNGRFATTGRFCTGGRGFTLIELLVVVAIIALLISITLPVLGTTIRVAQQSVCSSHLRQVTIATLNYAQESRFYLPQPATAESAFTASGLFTSDIDERAAEHLWFNVIDHFLNQGTIDYDDTVADRQYLAIKQDPVWKRFSLDDQKDNRTIKMNYRLGSQGSTLIFVRLEDVEEPSSNVFYGDGRADDIRVDGTADDFQLSEGRIGLRHEDGANISFVDGHVEHVRQDIDYLGTAPDWFAESVGPPRQILKWRPE